jgi:branched-chain amino acid transport system substrate-binding protein
MTKTQVLPRWVALLLAAWCWCAASARADDIVVAQVASKTHPNSAELSKGLELGYRIYFSAQNDKGGIAGRKLVLRNVDDGFVAARMVELTKELAADPQVLALAGYVGSGGLAQIAKSDLLKKLKIPMVAPLQGDKSVVAAANFFPFRAGFEDEVLTMVRHAIAVYGRKRIAVVHLDASFGPVLAEVAEQEAKKLGTPLIARAAYDVAPDKIESSSREAAARVAAADPDAIILITAGKVGAALIGALRGSNAGTTLYCISALQSQDVVKQLGAAQSRGVIFAQSVPYPFAGGSALVREYQAAMGLYAKGEPYSFSSIEGFAGAKITVAGLLKAGPNATRDKLLSALNSIGEIDLGGHSVRYAADSRRGWGRVDLTIVAESGLLVR